MIRLTTVHNYLDADFLVKRLEQHDIVCFTTNEHTSTMFQGFSGMLGSGIQVMVREEDYERAAEVLRQKTFEDSIIRCPSCDSTNVQPVSSIWENLWQSIVILFTLLVGTPVQQIQQKHRCVSCKYTFFK